MSRRLPPLLRHPAFVRLWLAGGAASVVLWLEVLASGLFTLRVTHSALAVALVTSARSVPLLGGAFVGALSEAWNRKRIVLGGLLLAAASSASVAVLGAFGLARPWHVGLAALVSGFVYATEMPARRRMVAESAGPERVGAAVAMDSVTNFATRVAGPLIGGAAFGAFGLAGTYAISTAISFTGALLVVPLAHIQARRAVSVRTLRQELAEGLAFAWRTPALLSLLGVTVVMNLFGYSYTTLLPPIGRQSFHLSDAGVGVLASAEPGGALLGGLLMTVLALRGRALGWLAGGVAILLTALGLAHLIPPVWPVCAVLLLGGLGSSLFTNYQTTILISATPPPLRSRAMGLVTVCIGCWPLGMLLAGALAQWLGPLRALTLMAWSGVVLLGCVILATARGGAGRRPPTHSTRNG